MTKQRYGRFLKLISTLLIVAFSGEQLLYAAPELKPSKFAFEEKFSLSYSFPESVAQIEDSYKAQGADKTVFLIQDAHTNESGQLNLSKSLDIILSNEKDLKYVFTEAGVGDNSLSFLRQYRPLAERTDLSRRYIRKGLLHGAEYLDLTSEHDFVIWGVESPELYLKSLDDYKQTAKERERFDTYLKKIDATIVTLKNRLFNPSLQRFDQDLVKYQKQELSLTDYFGVLTREASLLNISLSDFPHLKNLQTLKDKEAGIDFKKANDEQLKAVQSLSADEQKELKELTDSDKNSPFKLSSKDQKGQMAFYSLLHEKINASSYPELSKYFEYLKLAREVEAKNVLTEMKPLENQVLDAHAKTADEKTLVLCSQLSISLNKLFHLALTPEDHKEYKELSAGFGVEHLTGFLNKKIMDLKAHYDRSLLLETGYEDMVKRSEEFYALTKQRDHYFMDEMLKKMASESQTKAVLVTGGFHTVNLKSLLKAKGISFVSITPQVLKETNMKKYEDILLGQTVMVQPKLSSPVISTLMTPQVMNTVGFAAAGAKAFTVNISNGQWAATGARLGENTGDRRQEIGERKNTRALLTPDSSTLSPNNLGARLLGEKLSRRAWWKTFGYWGATKKALREKFIDPDDRNAARMWVNTFVNEMVREEETTLKFFEDGQEGLYSIGSLTLHIPQMIETSATLDELNSNLEVLRDSQLKKINDHSTPSKSKETSGVRQKASADSSSALKDAPRGARLGKQESSREIWKLLWSKVWTSYPSLKESASFKDIQTSDPNPSKQDKPGLLMSVAWFLSWFSSRWSNLFDKTAIGDSNGAEFVKITGSSHAGEEQVIRNIYFKFHGERHQVPVSRPSDESVRVLEGKVRDFLNGKTFPSLIAAGEAILNQFNNGARLGTKEELTQTILEQTDQLRVMIQMWRWKHFTPDNFRDQMEKAQSKISPLKSDANGLPSADAMTEFMVSLSKLLTLEMPEKFEGFLDEPDKAFLNELIKEDISIDAKLLQLPLIYAEFLDNHIAQAGSVHNKIIELEKLENVFPKTIELHQLKKSLTGTVVKIDKWLSPLEDISRGEIATLGSEDMEALREANETLRSWVLQDEFKNNPAGREALREAIRILEKENNLMSLQSLAEPLKDLEKSFKKYFDGAEQGQLFNPADGARLAMDRSVVTGASGFIGANLATYLSRQGEDIDLFVRAGSESKLNNPPRGSSVILGELPDAAKIKELTATAKVIYHLAAENDPPQANIAPEKSLAVALGTARLVEAAGNRRIVRTSSELVYSAGGAENGSADENAVLANFENGTAAGKWLDTAVSAFQSRAKQVQNATLQADKKFIAAFLADNPIPDDMKDKVYSLVKILEERLVAAAPNGLNVRLSQVYGPGDYYSKARIPALVRYFALGEKPGYKLWKNEPRRYIYVEDAVKILYEMGKLKTLPSDRVVNVGSPEIVTTEQAVSILQSLPNVSPKIEWADAPSSPRPLPDISKLQAMFRTMGLSGFHWTTLNEGLQKTVKWYRQIGLNEIRYEDVASSISDEASQALIDDDVVPQVVKQSPGHARDDLPVGNASGVPTLLITGGAGLIGNNTVRYFLETHPKYHIIIVDNFTYAGPKESLIDILGGKHADRVKVYKGDVVDADLMGRLVERSDAVIHFAAESNVDLSYIDNETFERTNIEGSRTVAEAVERENQRRKKNAAKPVRLIHISTDEVYGDTPPGSKGFFKEDMPLNPTNPYSVTKVKSEKIVQDLNSAEGSELGAMIVRMTNNYGPYKYPMNLLPNAVLHHEIGMPIPIFGSPHKTRDWLNVFDFARAMDVLIHEGKPNEIYNVSGNHQATLMDAVLTLLSQIEGKRMSAQEATQKGGPVDVLSDNRPHNDVAYPVDDFKIRNPRDKGGFGFRNVVTFDEGVKELQRWYRAHPEWLLRSITSDEYKVYYHRLYKDYPDKIKEMEQKIQAYADKHSGQTQGARLSKAQTKQLEDAAQLFKLSEASKLYLAQMWSQHLQREAGEHSDKDPLKIIIDRSHPEAGQNYILAAMLTDDERQTILGAFSYLLLVADPANALAAKDVAVIINSLDGGIGESLKRVEYLRARLKEAPDAKIELSAKGTDLGFSFNSNGREFFVSIAEAKLMRLLEDAKKGVYGKISLQPLVNWASRESYEKLFNETPFHYDLRNNIEPQNVASYASELRKNGIEILPMVEQDDLPGIDANTGDLVLDAKPGTSDVQPGGHGQWGFYFLTQAYRNNPPKDGKTHIRMFLNGDNLNERLDESVVGAMARQNIPIFKLTTPATDIDKKGGKDGLRVVKGQDGSVRYVPDQMEEADAKSANEKMPGQLDTFYAAGLEGGLGEAGKQPFNTNVFYFNDTILHEIVTELVTVVGEEEYFRIISPTYIKKPQKKTKAGRVYHPIDGAIGTAIHNLNSYFLTSDDPRVMDILKKRGLDRLLYFVDVPRSFFTPVKKTYDIYFQTLTNYFKLDTDDWYLKEADKGISPPEFDLKGSFWDEFQNLIDAFGELDVLRLKELLIDGEVLIKDATVVGRVRIENKSGKKVDLNASPYEGVLPKTSDGRLLLENTDIKINADGLMSVESSQGARLTAQEKKDAKEILGKMKSFNNKLSSVQAPNADLVRDRDELYLEAIGSFLNGDYAASLQTLQMFRAYLPRSNPLSDELAVLITTIDRYALKIYENSLEYKIATDRQSAVQKATKKRTIQPKITYDHVAGLLDGDVHILPSDLKKLEVYAESQKEKAKQEVLQRKIDSITEKSELNKVTTELELQLDERAKKLSYVAAIGAGGQSRRGGIFGNFMHWVRGFGRVRLMDFRIAQFAATAKKFKEFRLVLLESIFTHAKIDTALKDSMADTSSIKKIDRLSSALTHVYNEDGSVWRPDSVGGLSVPSHGDALIQLAFIIDELLEEGVDYYGFYNMNVVNSVPNARLVAYLDYLREKAKNAGKELPWTLFATTVTEGEKGGIATRGIYEQYPQDKNGLLQILDGWMVSTDDLERLMSKPEDYPLFNTNSNIIHLQTLRDKFFEGVPEGHLKRDYLAKHPQAMEKEILPALRQRLASIGNPDPKNQLPTYIEQKADPDDVHGLKKISQVSTMLGSSLTLDPNAVLAVVARGPEGEFEEFKTRPQIKNLERIVRQFFEEGRLSIHQDKVAKSLSKSDIIRWYLEDDIHEQASKNGSWDYSIVVTPASGGALEASVNGDIYGAIKALYELLPNDGEFENIVVDSQNSKVVINTLAAPAGARLAGEETEQDEDGQGPAEIVIRAILSSEWVDNMAVLNLIESAFKSPRTLDDVNGIKTETLLDFRMAFEGRYISEIQEIFIELQRKETLFNMLVYSKERREIGKAIDAKRKELISQEEESTIVPGNGETFQDADDDPRTTQLEKMDFVHRLYSVGQFLKHPFYRYYIHGSKNFTVNTPLPKVREVSAEEQNNLKRELLRMRLLRMFQASKTVHDIRNYRDILQKVKKYVDSGKASSVNKQTLTWIRDKFFGDGLWDEFLSVLNADGERYLSSYPTDELLAVKFIEVYQKQELEGEVQSLTLWLKSEYGILDARVPHHALFGQISQSVKTLVDLLSPHAFLRQQIENELTMRLYAALLRKVEVPAQTVRIGLTTSRDGQQSNYGTRYNGADQRAVISEQMDMELDLNHMETWGGAVPQSYTLAKNHGATPEDPWYNLKEQVSLLKIKLEEVIKPAENPYGISADDMKRLFDRYRFDTNRIILTDKELNELLTKYSIPEDVQLRIQRRYSVLQEMLLRGEYIVALKKFPPAVQELFIKTAFKDGVDIFRIFDAFNDPDNILAAIRIAKSVPQAKLQPTIHYHPRFPRGNEMYVELAKRFVRESGEQFHSLVIKDASGSMDPQGVFELIKALRADPETRSIAIIIHTHDTNGRQILTFAEAVRANHVQDLSQDQQPPIVLDVALVKGDPFRGQGGLSAPFGQPDLIDTVRFFAGEGSPISVANVDEAKIPQVTKAEERIRRDVVDSNRYGALTKLPSTDRILAAEALLPGGMYTNFEDQLLKDIFPMISNAVRGIYAIELYEEGSKALSSDGEQFKAALMQLISDEMKRVNDDMGLINSVTPTSQWMGVQAMNNVVYAIVLNSKLPEGAVSLAREHGALRFELDSDKMPEDRIKQYYMERSIPEFYNYFFKWSQTPELRYMYPGLNQDLLLAMFAGLNKIPGYSIDLKELKAALKADPDGMNDLESSAQHVAAVLKPFNAVRDALGKKIVDYPTVRAAEALTKVSENVPAILTREMVLSAAKKGGVIGLMPLTLEELYEEYPDAKDNDEEFLLQVLFPDTTQYPYLLKQRAFFTNNLLLLKNPAFKKENVVDLLPEELRGMHKLSDELLSNKDELRKFLIGKYEDILRRMGVPEDEIKAIGAEFGVQKPLTIAKESAATIDQEFTSVDVPEAFASALTSYKFKPVSIEAMPLKGALAVDKNIFLNDALANFSLGSSISQAIGSFVLVGRGKEVKDVADGNAVHFTERSMEYFTKINPKVAVVILADEGEKDGSYSLPIGSYYANGKKRSYTGISTLYEDLAKLRTEGYQILYFVGDALEKTNGLYSPEALTQATDSTSIFSFFTEAPGEELDGVNRFIVYDKTRIGGVSFNASEAAGVSPFDLPSVALPKIARQNALDRGLEATDENIADYINHTTLLTLGPRTALDKKATDTGPTHRHQAIIDDANALKERYPGLALVLPGDGDFLPRVVAILGLDLDGKHLVVFGRSGAPESIAATIAAADVKGGQFQHTFASETATSAKGYSAEHAYEYNEQEENRFKELGVSPGVYRSSRSTQDVKGKGIVAVTSVTGASEGQFGKSFSDLFQRVSVTPKEGSDNAANIVFHTLLVTPNGPYLVRSTFEVPNAEERLYGNENSIIRASHASRVYLDGSTGARLTKDIEVAKGQDYEHLAERVVDIINHQWKDLSVSYINTSESWIVLNGSDERELRGFMQLLIKFANTEQKISFRITSDHDHDETKLDAKLEQLRAVLSGARLAAPHEVVDTTKGEVFKLSGKSVVLIVEDDEYFRGHYLDVLSTWVDENGIEDVQFVLAQTLPAALGVWNTAKDSGLLKLVITDKSFPHVEIDDPDFSSAKKWNESGPQLFEILNNAGVPVFMQSSGAIPQNVPEDRFSPKNYNPQSTQIPFDKFGPAFGARLAEAVETPVEKYTVRVSKNGEFKPDGSKVILIATTRQDREEQYLSRIKNLLKKNGVESDSVTLAFVTKLDDAPSVFEAAFTSKNLRYVFMDQEFAVSVSAIPSLYKSAKFNQVPRKVLGTNSEKNRPIQVDRADYQRTENKVNSEFLLDIIPAVQGARLAINNSISPSEERGGLTPANLFLKLTEPELAQQIMEQNQPSVVVAPMMNNVAFQQFFAFVATAHAETRFAEVNVPILFSSNDLGIFGLKLSKNGTELTVTQKGFAPLTLDVQELIRSEDNKVTGAEVSVQDVMTLIRQRNEAIVSALDGLLDDASQAGVVAADLSMFGDIHQDATYFDLYVMQAFATSQRSYGKNVSFLFEGDEALQKVARERILQIESDNSSFKGKLGSLFISQASEGTNIVHFKVPGQYAAREHHRFIPMQRPEPGDLMTYPFALAIAAVRMELSADKALEDNFKRAYELALGQDVKDSGELKQVLLGSATFQTILKYALKPILKLAVNVYMQAARMMQRTLGAAA